MRLMSFGLSSFHSVSPVYPCKWITELFSVNNKFYNKVSKVCVAFPFDLNIYQGDNTR